MANVNKIMESNSSDKKVDVIKTFVQQNTTNIVYEELKTNLDLGLFAYFKLGIDLPFTRGAGILPRLTSSEALLVI